MKTTLRSELLLLGLTVLPLVYLAFVWSTLPDTVPTHFGPTGQPDSYAAKEALATGILVLMLGTYALLRALPALDPNKNLDSASYARIRSTLTLFMAGLAIIILYIIRSGKTGDVVSDLILSAVFLLFAAMGNVMLTVPRNYFVGIKTPWALASDANWRQTHRLAGKLWVTGGLAGLVLGLMLPSSAKLFLVLGITVVLAAVPYVYSYWLFRKGLVVALLLLAGTSGQAQTSELMTYAITQPAGASLTLEGTLTIPTHPPKALPVVMLIAGSGPVDRNGNGAGLITNAYQQLADSLTHRGIAVLRYDKRGSGTNRHHFIQNKVYEYPILFEDAVADAVGFLNQLRADKRFTEVIVVGHSEGSLVGMLAATQTTTNRFISIAGTGQNIADVLKKQFADGGINGEALALTNRDLDSLRAGQRVRQPFQMLSSFFTPTNQTYLMSWMNYDPAQVIRQVRGPVLLIQGRHDIQVAVTEAERLLAARPDARLIYIDRMNHMMKEGPADRAGNIASYTTAGSTIMPAVVNGIVNFVVGKK